jgi:hypothetical protein
MIIMEFRVLKKGRAAWLYSTGRPFIFEASCSYCPNLFLYSSDEMKALTSSARM